MNSNYFNHTDFKIFSTGDPCLVTYGLGDVMGPLDKQDVSPFCIGRCIERGHATHNVNGRKRGRIITENIKNESCPYCCDAIYYAQRYAILRKSRKQKKKASDKT